jgi:hypothetical protein
LLAPPVTGHFFSSLIKFPPMSYEFIHCTA